MPANPYDPTAAFDPHTNPYVSAGGAWSNPGASYPAPAYTSPQSFYEFVMRNVPGISPAAASWLQSVYLGGQSMSPIDAQLNGLSLDQYNQIMGLSMAGATPTSGVYSSDVRPSAPGIPGQGGLNPPPGSRDVGPGSGGNLHPPAVPPVDSGVGRPPNTPPPENPPPGWFNGTINGVPVHDPLGANLSMDAPVARAPVAAVRPPAGGIDYYDTGAGLAGANQGLGYPGHGATLAERALGFGGGGGVSQLDGLGLSSPLKYLRRRGFAL